VLLLIIIVLMVTGVESEVCCVVDCTAVDGDDNDNVTEAEKVAFVAKIQWDQKIMEKESEKKMAEIEGKPAVEFLTVPCTEVFCMQMNSTGQSGLDCY